jgi:hypothetical protein
MEMVVISGVSTMPQKYFRRLSHGEVPPRHVFREGLKKESDHEIETEPVCRRARRNAGLA